MNRTPILFLHVLIIATCGLIYELIAGTLASYVLGDSITQFSLIIGIYLFALGVLVGLELPLLMRIIKENLDFKELVSRVLAVDYVGALVAAILFPIFLVPRLGLVRTSLVFGILNAVVGLWGTWVLRPLIKGNLPGLRGRAAIVIALLCVGVIKADRLTSMAEDGLFADEIIYARSSSYQRLVITRGRW